MHTCVAAKPGEETNVCPYYVATMAAEARICTGPVSHRKVDILRRTHTWPRHIGLRNTRKATSVLYITCYT